MRKQQGLTLVETLISITLFSVLSAAAASLMLSSINMREGNQRSLKSEQFVKRIFEQHKDFWSVKENYNLTPDYSITAEFLQDFPDDMSLIIEYSCLNTDGTIISSDNNALNCGQLDPPLRRVTIKILKNGQIVAQQKTDIGRPIARRGD